MYAFTQLDGVASALSFADWQRHDLGVAELRRDDRARLIAAAPDEGECQWRMELSRETGRRDVSRLLAICRDRRPGGRNGFSRELESKQSSIDVAQGVDPGDGFLAEIAALCKANGVLVSGNFLRQVVDGHVLPVDRNAHLDAGDMHRIATACDNIGRV